MFYQITVLKKKKKNQSDRKVVHKKTNERLMKPSTKIYATRVL